MTCIKRSKRHDHSKENKHHIFPRHAMGRKGNPYKALQGGQGNNVAIVCQGCHEVMNELFGGHATPLEILDFLINEMWNGQRFWLDEYLDEN